MPVFDQRNQKVNKQYNVAGQGASGDTFNLSGDFRGHADLPAHCSACGGPLRPDEVDWLDATTAECPYCGNPVKAPLH